MIQQPDCSTLSVDLFCGLLNHLEEGIILLDCKGGVMFWNVWMTRMSGVSLKAAKGNTLPEIFPSLMKTRVPGAITWALQRKLPSVLSTSLNPSPFPLGDDHVVEQSIRVMPLDLKDGFGYAMVQIDDVSAIVERERILRLRARQLRDLALIDPLTGVANRRRFQEYFDNEVRRHQRRNQVLSLIIFDVDYFKHYNDTYGHSRGDECLISICMIVNAALHRAGDMLARVGGEEFAILLPDTEAEGAAKMAEEVRQAVEDAAIPHADSLVARVVTISLGVASVSLMPNISGSDLYSAADGALYDAKDAGRNGWRQLKLGNAESGS